MRSTVDFFRIDGRPMLAPDGEVNMNFEDLDGAESGRDQQGVMHRIVLRRKVPSWEFHYANLSEEERAYMESLFHGDTFLFTHPDRLNSGQLTQTECYRSRYGITWRNASTGLWSGYKFTVIAC